MGNTWFQFKQFRVKQAGAALKVGTDACILGAWANCKAPKRILDIGTGTGLLALMLAQRHANAQIDALEPEPGAACQAKDNFSDSPWPNRLLLCTSPVQEYYPNHRYELIVCNPPFYQKHLKTADHARNVALHQDLLSFQELAQACARLLDGEGICYILLPPAQACDFELEAARSGLYVCQRLLVQERTTSPIHRTVMGYTLRKPLQEELIYLTIRGNSNLYSPHYRNLLREYYLKM